VSSSKGSALPHKKLNFIIISRLAFFLTHTAMERRQLFARVLRERSTGLGLMLAMWPKSNSTHTKTTPLHPSVPATTHPEWRTEQQTCRLRARHLHVSHSRKAGGPFYFHCDKVVRARLAEKKTRRLFCVRSPLSTLKGERLVYLKHACRHEVSLVRNGFFRL
jgi:hypothetical protein